MADDLRAALADKPATERMVLLRERGICYQCYDLETDGGVFGVQPTIYDDERVRIVLESRPRMKGHTIVVYKPHHDDLSSLADAEAGYMFAVCVRGVRALKRALGAEKVYVNTMCDGGINHLHLQLLPRYAGESIGSRRFVASRGVREDGDTLAAQIHAALRAEGNMPVPPTTRVIQGRER